MYCKVQSEKCIACGLCQLAAPKIFGYDPEGIAYNQTDANTGTKNIASDQEKPTKSAFKKCPTGAIELARFPFQA